MTGSNGSLVKRMNKAMPTSRQIGSGSQPPTRCVRLPANCTIREIAGLHACLRTALRKDSLDGSAVERIDSAGIKLLAAFVRERRAAGCQTDWTAASSVLSEAVLRVGLATAINLPVGR